MTDNELDKIKAITFAQLNKLIINDLNKLYNKTSITIKYNKEQIIYFLENPMKYQKELRILSRYLYENSANYRRLIWYFSSMLRFDYIVEPYDLDTSNVRIDTFTKQYNDTLKLLEIMNISHEMVRVLRIAFKEDVFYGYEHSTNDSYFIQKLDPNFCRVSSIEDGVYNFEYDFSFFDNNLKLLKNFPNEFQDKYNLYQRDKSGLRWQELKSDNTICIKINEELDYPLPPFNTVFESVFEIDETKRMRKVKTKIDNYMILTQKIPIDENGGEVDKFLIDLDTAISFHNKAAQSLPEEVGLVTSPMPIEAIKFDRNGNSEVDYVAQVERDYFNAAGISQMLFNSDQNSSVGLNKSILTDEEIAFTVLRQIERWLNRKLKKKSKSYKFRVKFLETTIFNVSDVRKDLLQSAQYGMPVKTALAATYGMSPSGFNNMVFLENEILKLQDNLIPLASSHTQSDNTGGAPSKSDSDLSDSGDKTRSNDSNNR